MSNVEEHPRDLASRTASHFGVTRQAVNKHLKKLVIEKALIAEGQTRHRSYRLASLFEWTRTYAIGPGLEEDQVWSKDVSPVSLHFPLYEQFWLLHVFPLRGDDGQIRADIDERLELWRKKTTSASSPSPRLSTISPTKNTRQARFARF